MPVEPRYLPVVPNRRSVCRLLEQYTHEIYIINKQLVRTAICKISKREILRVLVALSGIAIKHLIIKNTANNIENNNLSLPN